MSDVVTVAIVGAVGSGLCSLLGVIASGKLTQYRLQELEKKVNKHNNLVERMFGVEQNLDKLNQKVNLLHRHDE